MISLLSVQPSTFVSDNTVEQVALVKKATVSERLAIEENNSGATFGLFAPDDNFKIKGIAVYLPHLYAVGRDALQITLTCANPTATPDEGYWLNFQSKIPIYQENVEIDINTFLLHTNNFPYPAGENLGIGILLDGSIGMFNAPSMLNGVTLAPTIVLRIEHTLPMVVFP